MKLNATCPICGKTSVIDVVSEEVDEGCMHYVGAGVDRSAALGPKFALTFSKTVYTTEKPYCHTPVEVEQWMTSKGYRRMEPDENITDVPGLICFERHGGKWTPSEYFWNGEGSDHQPVTFAEANLAGILYCLKVNAP